MGRRGVWRPVPLAVVEESPVVGLRRQTVLGNFSRVIICKVIPALPFPAVRNGNACQQKAHITRRVREVVAFYLFTVKGYRNILQGAHAHGGKGVIGLVAIGILVVCDIFVCTMKEIEHLRGVVIGREPFQGFQIVPKTGIEVTCAQYPRRVPGE